MAKRIQFYRLYRSYQDTTIYDTGRLQSDGNTTVPSVCCSPTPHQAYYAMECPEVDLYLYRVIYNPKLKKDTKNLDEIEDRDKSGEVRFIGTVQLEFVREYLIGSPEFNELMLKANSL